MSEVHIGQDLIWNTILLQADASLKVKVAKKKGGMIMIGEGVVLVGGHCVALHGMVGGDCVPELGPKKVILCPGAAAISQSITGNLCGKPL